MSTLGVQTPGPGQSTAVPTQDEVRAKALELQNSLIEKHGLGAANEDVARAASAVPVFSKGTVSIDEQTGKPVGQVDDPGTIGGTTVTRTAEELGGDPDRSLAAAGSAAAEAAATAMLQAKPADAGVTAAATETPPPAPKETPQTPGPAAAAAEAAAAEIARKWEDYEEVEYDDPEAGQKYTVYALKDQAPAVKNGYARRSIMDRHATWLGQAKGVLEPLITSGEILQVLPLIQRAMQDPEFGAFVVDAYNRRVRGQELTPAQAAAADAVHAAGGAAAVSAAAGTIPGNDGYIDPFLDEAMKPIRTELGEVKTTLQTLAERDRQAAAAQQQRQQIEADVNNILAQTHRDLHAMYPDAFKGDWASDEPLFKKIYQYGTDAGYFRSYGFNPATFRLAYAELRNARPGADSVAAGVIRQVEAATAAATPRSVPSGAPVTATPPGKPAPKPINMRRADGTMISAREYAEQKVGQMLSR